MRWFFDDEVLEEGKIEVNDHIRLKKNNVFRRRIIAGLVLSYLFMFFGGLYATCLSASILLPRRPKVIASLDDLVSMIENKEYRILTETLSYTWFQLIFSSDVQFFRRMRRAIEVNPPKVVDEVKDIKRMLGSLDENYIYATRTPRAYQVRFFKTFILSNTFK